MNDYHIPALFNESLNGLNVKNNGTYVDATFGGGGHSTGIIQNLSKGKLFAFDQDEDAKSNSDQLALDFPERSFTFIESNFRYIKKFLRLHGVDQVDGIIADLGVSSYQFDRADRGFSIRYDGELDMRMNRNEGITARELIDKITEHDLIHLLSYYGNIKNARSLARGIIEFRSSCNIVNTSDLKQVTLNYAPVGKDQKYLAQVFQSFRIVVNDEIESLRSLLVQSSELVKPGGRLVVISYHSLEDRLVKNFINTGGFSKKINKDFYGNVIRPFDAINKKVITPSEEEIEMNNRVRSARLRIAERK